MTTEQLAEKIWNHPDTKTFLRNDWQRWTSSGYHITKRMDLDTLIETAYGMVDLGLPEFYKNWYEGNIQKIHKSRTEKSKIPQPLDESDIRAMYYTEAESPEVIAILTKKLWDRTPKDLRPEPEPDYWFGAVQKWLKKFLNP